MEDKKYIVYQHINQQNGKYYFGITCQKPEKRWGLNGERYRECPHFWCAIQKYGWNNFAHLILASGLSHDEACEMEKRLITENDATNPNKGYNLSKGGDGHDSEEWIEKWKDPDYKSYMRDRMQEAWQDPDKRKRRSDAAKTRWSDGNFHDNVVQKVIEACARPVICVETGEKFNVLKDAAERYNASSANITRSCKTGYRCSGYHWKYVDDILLKA